MVVTEIQTVDEFESALSKAGENLVVVDFYATWCGPCRVIGPKLEALEKKLNIVVFKVDVDEATELAERFDISAMPTFLFFKKERKIDEMVGASEDKLKEKIEKHLN